jgi:hypothetical protein
MRKSFGQVLVSFPLAYWKGTVDLLVKLGATALSDSGAKPSAVSAAVRAECIWRHISLDRRAPWLAPLQILILVAMSSLSLALGATAPSE